MALDNQHYKAIFVDKFKLLTPEQFDEIIKFADQTKRPVDQLLMERSFITPHQFLELLANYYEMPSTELDISDIDPKAMMLVPEEFASTNLALAFKKDEQNVLHVATVNPKDGDLLAKLKTQDPFIPDIKFYITTENALRKALVLYDGNIKDKFAEIVNNLDVIGESLIQGSTAPSPIISLVNLMIETGIIYEASDIHIEPSETETYIRFRIDGVLRTIVKLPTRYHVALLARLKVLANLKIDQKQLPQDGRFSTKVKGQDINIRISTVPSLWGEKPVLRLLPKEAHLFDINNLGLLDKDCQIIKSHIKRPHGLILVCGPTGSGKTTSLYALLQEIGTDRIDTVNISTVEDPIEYTIPRVTQIQVHPEIDLTFANGLRALLRQDPDIIMVGEIRDAETADFAIRAALVGRLVFSSLHTNDAPGAIPRLLDMGLEPYIVSSTLSLVIAQRLARKLCSYCRQSYTPTEELLDDLKKKHGLDQALQTLSNAGIVETPASTLRFYKAVGCARCDKTGYRGRMGLYEILEVTDELRKAINTKSDSSEINRIARATGMKSMFEDGLAKIIMGEIDIDELLKVAYS